LDEKVLAAVIGNVGTMVTFRVGSSDAEILAKEFIPTFVEEDLVNLPKYQVYLKLMIDGVASRPFSAETLGAIGFPTNSSEKVVRVSRERYATAREKIEDKIMRWSGLVPGMTDEDDENGDGVPVVPAPEKPKTPPAPSPVVNLRSTTFAKPPKPAAASPVKPAGNQPPRQGGGQKPGANRPPDRRNSQPKKPMTPPEGTPEKVLLVDTAQKGISLSQAMPVVEKAPPAPVLAPAPAPENPENTAPKPLSPGQVTTIDDLRVD
jgi:hypothetical protein